MGFSLYFMNLTHDAVVDADRAGIADFLERHAVASSSGDGSYAISPMTLSFDGSSSDLHLEALDQEGPVSGGIWHATLSAQECDFIFELCLAGKMVIVNPQGSPQFLVPGPARDPASLPEVDGPDLIVTVSSGDDIRRHLSGDVEQFEKYRDRVTGRADAPASEDSLGEG